MGTATDTGEGCAQGFAGMRPWMARRHGGAEVEQWLDPVLARGALIAPYEVAEEHVCASVLTQRCASLLSLHPRHDSLSAERWRDSFPTLFEETPSWRNFLPATRVSTSPRINARWTATARCAHVRLSEAHRYAPRTLSNPGANRRTCTFDLVIELGRLALTGRGPTCGRMAVTVANSSALWRGEPRSAAQVLSSSLRGSPRSLTVGA